MTQDTSIWKCPEMSGVCGEDWEISQQRFSLKQVKEAPQQTEQGRGGLSALGHGRV